MNVMTIGASHVNAFVGVGGPYFVDSDLDGDIDTDDEPQTAADLNISEGDLVTYDGEECKVVKVSPDGLSLKLKTRKGVEHKGISPSEVEVQTEDAAAEAEEDEAPPPPPKKAAGKPAAKKPDPEPEPDPEALAEPEAEPEPEPEAEEAPPELKKGDRVTWKRGTKDRTGSVTSINYRTGQAAVMPDGEAKAVAVAIDQLALAEPEAEPEPEAEVEEDEAPPPPPKKAVAKAPAGKAAAPKPAADDDWGD
jgi:hypothetical protein